MSEHLLLNGNSCWDFWNYRRGVLARLLASGYRLTIVALADDTTELLAEMGIEICPLSFARGGKSPAANALLFTRYLRLFRCYRPDLVIHYGIKPCIFGGIAAKAIGVPSVKVITGLGSALIHGGLLARLVHWLYRFALSSAVRVLFLNTDDRDYFLEHHLVSLAAVDLLPGEGIDVDHYAFLARGQQRRGRIFLFVGRLIYDKGVLEFVLAARLLRKSYPDSRCLLLGSIDQANPSSVKEKELAEWIARGDIEYLGKLNDVRQSIADADCVVLPSYREGLPRALLEAASIGRLQIASAVAGCIDVVVNGETGYLCQMADTTDLTMAMLKVASMEDEDVSRMGRQARKRVCDLFSDDVVFERYQSLVSSIFKH